MRRAEIEALAARWMRFWQGAGLAGFDDVHAEDFVDRSASGRPADRAGLRAAIERLHAAFPDFLAATAFVAVDEARGLATIRWTAHGRHAGAFLGRAPTGRRVTFEGIEIVRCHDGAVAERWGEWNEGSILEQIAG